MKKKLYWIAEKNIQNKKISDTDQKQLHYICPYCQQQIVTFENNIVETIEITCPNCGKKGIIRPEQKKQESIFTNMLHHITKKVNVIDEVKKITIPAFEVKNVGIILIIIGTAFQYLYNLYTYNISFALVIIGVIIFIFIPENRMIFIRFHRTPKKEKPKNEVDSSKKSSPQNFYQYLNQQFDISEKIAIILILWIIFIYLLTGVLSPGLNNIDWFFIFIYIGILIMRVFSTGLIPVRLKQRMNVLVIAFLVIFIIVIIKRLYTII